MSKRKSIRPISKESPLSTTQPKERQADISSKDTLFAMENYVLMIAGLVVLVIGFALMAGGQQKGAEFNYDEIYSFRRITLAPIVVVIGFLIEIFAIFYKPRKMGNQAV